MFARPSHVAADAAAVAAGQSAAAVAAADHTMVSQSAPFPCLGAAAPDRVTISLLVSAPSLVLIPSHFHRSGHVRQTLPCYC